MGRTGICHHIGTFLLFAASILIMITTITSPVIHDLALLKVTLTNKSDIRNSSVTFGTFGYCILDAAPANTQQDYCSGRKIGYNPVDIMAKIDNTTYNVTLSNNTKSNNVVTLNNGSVALTDVMVLHPITSGLSFLAFLLSLGAGVCGSFLAALVIAGTFVLTLGVVITDIILFNNLGSSINNHSIDHSGSVAKWGPGMITLIVAMIVQFLAFFVVLFSCCSERIHRRRDERVGKEGGYGDGYTPVPGGGGAWGPNKPQPY